MRSTWIAALFFAGAVFTSGCAINSQTAEDEQASVTEAAASTSIYKKLVGDYVSGDTLEFPTLSLASGTKGRT